MLDALQRCCCKSEEGSTQRPAQSAIHGHWKSVIIAAAYVVMRSDQRLITRDTRTAARTANDYTSWKCEGKEGVWRRSIKIQTVAESGPSASYQH